MPHRNSDTAYIQTNPNCIGDHAIRARGEIFKYIAEIAKDMGAIASKDGEKSPRKLRAGDWYQNVVSIIGERGSGKTVLLMSACACLGKGSGDALPDGHKEEEWGEHEKMLQKVTGDILLPIIQPEYFGLEDTLITWVLTYLKEYIEEESNKERFKTVKIKQDDGNDDDEGDKPSELITQMRRDEALFSRKFPSKLAEQDVTAEDFQGETLKVVDAQDCFTRNWRKLINNLIETKDVYKTEAERKDRPFLIIPIDDADLNPAALPLILRQMQFLHHPNVLFLFSVHIRSLQSMMYISQLELNTNRADTRPVVNYANLLEHKLRDKEDVRVDAGNKIEKYLPRKYQVELRSLSPKERLTFKPLINNDHKGNTTNKWGRTDSDDGKEIRFKRDAEKVKDSGTHTFLELLEKIPVSIFGDRRVGDLSKFFDLAQAFAVCPLPLNKVCCDGSCRVCKECKKGNPDVNYNTEDRCTRNCLLKGLASTPSRTFHSCHKRFVTVLNLSTTPILLPSIRFSLILLRTIC